MGTKSVTNTNTVKKAIPSTSKRNRQAVRYGVVCFRIDSLPAAQQHGTVWVVVLNKKSKHTTSDYYYYYRSISILIDDIDRRRHAATPRTYVCSNPLLFYGLIPRRHTQILPFFRFFSFLSFCSLCPHQHTHHPHRTNKTTDPVRTPYPVPRTQTTRRTSQ